MGNGIFQHHEAAEEFFEEEINSITVANQNRIKLIQKASCKRKSPRNFANYVKPKRGLDSVQQHLYQI